MSNLTLNTNNATAYNNTSITVLDSSTIKMTSQEIADLVQSRHDNVKSSIEYLVSKGTIQCPVEKVIKNFQNRDMKVYEFEGEQGKRDCMIVVAQLSPQFLGTVVDRWMYLEKKALEMVKPSYMIEDPIERAKKWIEEATAKQAIETKLVEATQAIEVMQPTVDAYDMIAGKRGSMCFSDAYKFLGGIKLKEMKQWMLDKKWMYRDRFDRDNISYAYQQNGYLVVKATTHQPQIRITYKGLAAMARQMKIKLNPQDFA